MEPFLRIRNIRYQQATFFALIGAALVVVGCSTSTQSSLGLSVGGAHANASGRRLKPAISPPLSGDYLGAWVYPGGSKSPTPIESDTEALEKLVYNLGTTQQHFALHLQYRDWVAMASIGSDVGVADDIANGRVPIISWNCGDDIPPYTKASPIPLIGITAGLADADLATINSQIATLKTSAGSPYPVILRYFWEFNINASHAASPYDNNGNGNNNCFLPPGAQPDGSINPSLSTQFIDAWNHIHSKLTASNITFDWNPNIQDTDPAYGLGGAPVVDPSPFYPGNSTVDWIGVDGYSKLSSGSPKSFSDVFSTWYTEFAPYGQPMLIGETGSCQSYGNHTPSPQLPDQAGYIQQIQSALESGSYPRIRAVNYFDAAGAYQPGGVTCDWRLDSNVQGTDSVSGLQAFSNLANDTTFLHMIVP